MARMSYGGLSATIDVCKETKLELKQYGKCDIKHFYSYRTLICSFLIDAPCFQRDVITLETAHIAIRV